MNMWLVQLMLRSGEMVQRVVSAQTGAEAMVVAGDHLRATRPADEDGQVGIVHGHAHRIGALTATGAVAADTGAEISDEQIEAIVAEAEQGLDVEKLRPRELRKSAAVLQVQLELEWFRPLMVVAQRYNKTPAEVARLALIDFLFDFSEAAGEASVTPAWAKDAE